jgi:hypothetical protein
MSLQEKNNQEGVKLASDLKLCSQVDFITSKMQSCVNTADFKP